MDSIICIDNQNKKKRERADAENYNTKRERIIEFSKISNKCLLRRIYIFFYRA
jgi:hypothetical protein